MPLSGGSPGVAAGGTAGQILRKTSATDYAMEWASLASVPGAGSNSIVDKAPVPHPSDDEFSDGSLTGWTQVNGGGSPVITWTEAGDALSVLYTNTSSALLCQLKPISIGIGGYIQTAVTYGNVDCNTYLLFTNGILPSSNILGSIFGLGGAYNPNSYVGIGGGTIAAHGISSSGLFLPYSPLHVRLTWLAVNSWRVQFSPDGISWVPGLDSSAITLTPTHMGIGVSCNGGPRVTSFEYFRASA